MNLIIFFFKVYFFYSIIKKKFILYGNISDHALQFLISFFFLYTFNDIFIFIYKKYN